MIVVMKHDADKNNIAKVKEFIENAGLKTQVSSGDERTIIGVIGNKAKIDQTIVANMTDVLEVIEISKPFKRAAREMHPEDTVIELFNGTKIGGTNPAAVMAGPCTVENLDMLLDIAENVKKSGATILRGGAFKPRTSPYAFQGLGEQGLKYLAETREKTGLAIVTEVMDTRDVALVAEYADILQLGTRNMQNFALLKEVGKTNKPVLLKRGMAATIEEWLMAAEYILAEGNEQVMLCERGIRTIETYTRNTLDLSAIPVIKKMSHLPIVVDPSHAVGYWDYVSVMSKAAIVAGANGLIIEVHNNPQQALCDGGQCLKVDVFDTLMQDIRKLESIS